eukprot:COSAG03_NODE_6_length_26200_cov_62.015517_3_plen_147_part_00
MDEDFEAEWAAAEPTPSAIKAHSAADPAQSARHGSASERSLFTARRRPAPPPLSAASAIRDQRTDEARHLARLAAAEVRLSLSRSLPACCPRSRSLSLSLSLSLSPAPPRIRSHCTHSRRRRARMRSVWSGLLGKKRSRRCRRSAR